jgi:histidinol-phosphate aminotransferase
LHAIKQTFNVNILAQCAASIALKDKDYLIDSIYQVNQNRQFLFSLFKNANIDFVSSHTNFVLVNTYTQADQVYRKLINLGIVVQPMSFYGLDNYIRVSIGTADQSTLLVKALTNIF